MRFVPEIVEVSPLVGVWQLFSFTSSIKDRWSEELEMYRYKLNKAYPLCARCTFFTQNRLQEEKVLLFYVFLVIPFVSAECYENCDEFLF